MKTVYYLITKVSGDKKIMWSSFKKTDFEYQLSKFCMYDFTVKRISREQAFDLKREQGINISGFYKG